MDVELAGGRVALPADEEERAFRELLAQQDNDCSTAFTDPVFRRLQDALGSLAQRGRARPLDAAVLLRQAIRRFSLRDESSYRLAVEGDLGALIDAGACDLAGLTSVPTATGGRLFQAAAWTPEWLGASDHTPADRAALAGSFRGVRAPRDSVSADPFFAEATGYVSYKSPGQRAAVRAAMTMPDGGTLIALLPTGSGKTEIALTLARTARGMTTIIVVPTTALAYDFERRFRLAYAQRPGVSGDDLAFAWTYETRDDRREELKRLLAMGQVPLLVTSPESLNGTLLNSVRSAAEGGRIRALVIDEAHLVTQWGRDFRPDFRELAVLRRDLLRRNRAGGHAQLKTILLSATLSSDVLLDLRDLFEKPGPMSLVAANAMRPEIEFFVADLVDPLEREQRVLEAVRMLPRPLLLYVTTPDKAEQWAKRLKDLDLGRTAIVTGRTAGELRQDVLDGLRTSPDRQSRYDVVVATSAFGLGIDNDEIRSVVHACLPETVDRWYQEAGRAGRDGHLSVAVLVPAFGDDEEAASLGIVMLKPETAEARWKSLWDGRKRLGGASYVDLESSPPGSRTGSYNHRWNAQVLGGLEQLKQLTRRPLTRYEAHELGLPVSEGQPTHDWEGVELDADELQRPGFFAEVWDPWRQALVTASWRSLQNMKSASGSNESVCDLIAAEYRPSTEVVEYFGEAALGAQLLPGCGKCPGCRQRRVAEPADASPSGPFTWWTIDTVSAGLSRLLRECPSGADLAIVYSSQVSKDAQALADAALAAGVRHFAGVTPKAPRGTVILTDPNDVHPSELPPLASLVVPDPGSELSIDWTSEFYRSRTPVGETAPLVLLLRRGTLVGTERRAVERTQSLPIRAALSLLKV